MFAMKRFGAVAAVLGLVALGVTAMPGKAEAWWRGGWHGGWYPGWHAGWCCGVRVGVWAPPVVVGPVYAPPPAYYARPAYYGPPRRVWIAPHYRGPYWVPGHWS